MRHQTRRIFGYILGSALLMAPAFAQQPPIDVTPPDPASAIQPVDVDHVIHLLSDPESAGVQCYLGPETPEAFEAQLDAQLRS